MAAAAISLGLPLVIQYLPSIIKLVESIVGNGKGPDKQNLAIKILNAAHNGLVDLKLAQGPAPALEVAQTAVDLTVKNLNADGVLQGRNTVLDSAAPALLGFNAEVLVGATAISKALVALLSSAKA